MSIPWRSVEVLFDGAVGLDEQSVVLDVDPAGEATFGRTAAEMVGRPLQDFVPRADEHRAYAAAREPGDRGWRQTRGVHGNGKLFPLVLSFLRTDERCAALIRDLSQLPKAAAPSAGDGAWWEFHAATGQVLWSPDVYALHEVDPATFDPNMETIMGRLDPQDVDRIRQVLRDLLVTGVGEATEYRLAHSTRVLEVVGRIERAGPGGPMRGMHGLVRDVTRLRLSATRLAIHEAVDATLRHWETSSVDVRALLQRLYLALGWRVAALWVPKGERLECRGFVSESGMEVGRFEQATRDMVAGRSGGTITGQAWLTQRAVAVPDLSESNYVRARAADADGLRGSVAIPAVDRGEVLAVLELFHHDRREFDPDLLETFDAVGRQLGAFLYTRRGMLGGMVVTPREREVLLLASGGATVSDIAAQLHLSPATIKTHFQNVYGKLGVNDRPAAVAVALRTGIID